MVPARQPGSTLETSAASQVFLCVSDFEIGAPGFGHSWASPLPRRELDSFRTNHKS